MPRLRGLKSTATIMASLREALHGSRRVLFSFGMHRERGREQVQELNFGGQMPNLGIG